MKTVRTLALLSLDLCLAFVSTACFGVGEVSKATTEKVATPPVYEGISLRGDANIARQGQAGRYLASGDPVQEDAASVEGDCLDEFAAFDPEADPFVAGTAPLEEKRQIRLPLWARRRISITQKRIRISTLWFASATRTTTRSSPSP